MRFSDAKGRKIVSISSAETVGKLDDFVVDPRRRAVVALEVKKTDGGDTLMWSEIAAFGADAITVTGADMIDDQTPEVAALAGKDHRIVGKRLLSAAGDELGGIDDVEFDPETGQLRSLITGDLEIDADRLIGIGSYAVVVTAD